MAALGVLLGASALLGGCSEEPPPPVAVAPPTRPTAPPPPPKPTVTPIADLMAAYKIDPRVVLPEDKAPDNDPDRIAVLQFFDAFARGDEQTAGAMMTVPDRMELEALVRNGSWKRTAEDVDMIEVQTGRSEYGPCALAVFSVGMDFQPQLWYYHGDGSTHTFEAAASPPGILDRLSGTDWIKAWHDVLAEELALANQPDDEVDVEQQNLDDGNAGSAAQSGSGPGSSPGFSPASSPPGFGRRPPGRSARRPVPAADRAAPRDGNALQCPPAVPLGAGGRFFRGTRFAIDQRVAIVTGASRGIGRAIAERFAADGRLVVLVSRGREQLESVREGIEQMGGQAEVQPCDVADGEALSSLVERVASTHGRLDILINNAGITRDGLILRMTDDDFDEVLSVNLKSAFVACRAAARPMMRSRFGRIINIGSVTGVVGNAGQANYAAAKAGLIGLTKTIAKEFGGKGITANVVAPGFVDTEMVAGLPQQALDEVVKRLPVRRLGQPEEIAHTVGFLASDLAGYVTGQVILVDGGLTC